MTDLELLIRDKYEGDAEKVTSEDEARLAAGEPLAYVIGWIPFLSLRIGLTSKPLIPRPETEWWAEQFIARLRERFGSDTAFHFLDLCAGSGAIGLAVLHAFPAVHVTFGELEPSHCAQIRENISLNNLDANRATVCTSDLFDRLLYSNSNPQRPFQFDAIACNPPYIPSTRTLDVGVTNFEPHNALFAGTDGLELITRIANQAAAHLNPNGELWLEADIENIEQAAQLLQTAGATRTVILNDLYDRPRVVVAYYP